MKIHLDFAQRDGNAICEHLKIIKPVEVFVFYFTHLVMASSVCMVIYLNVLQHNTAIFKLQDNFRGAMSMLVKLAAIYRLLKHRLLLTKY